MYGGTLLGTHGCKGEGALPDTPDLKRALCWALLHVKMIWICCEIYNVALILKRLKTPDPSDMLTILCTSFYNLYARKKIVGKINTIKFVDFYCCQMFKILANSAWCITLHISNDKSQKLDSCHAKSGIWLILKEKRYVNKTLPSILNYIFKVSDILFCMYTEILFIYCYYNPVIKSGK